MPYLKKYKKAPKRSYRKRITKKAKRYGKSKSPLSYYGSQLNPLPQRVLTTMTWTTEHGFTCTATDPIAVYYVRNNSIYDPEYDIGGKSAQGYDIFAQLYNTYRVYAVDVEMVQLSALDQSANNVTGNTLIGFVPVNNTDVMSTVGSNIDQLLSLPRVRWNTADNEANNRVVKAKFNLPSLLGYSNVQYKTDDLFMSGFGSNPAAYSNTACWAYSPYADVDTDIYVRCIIKFKYYVEITNPQYKNLIQS